MLDLWYRDEFRTSTQEPFVWVINWTKLNRFRRNWALKPRDFSCLAPLPTLKSHKILVKLSKETHPSFVLPEAIRCEVENEPPRPKKPKKITYHKCPQCEYISSKSFKSSCEIRFFQKWNFLINSTVNFKIIIYNLIFEIFLVSCDFYKTLGRNASDIAKHRLRRHTQSVEFTKICPVGDCTENYRTKVWIQNWKVISNHHT